MADETVEASLFAPAFDVKSDDFRLVTLKLLLNTRLVCKRVAK